MSDAACVKNEAARDQYNRNPKKLVVCVHGMGDQMRSSFAQEIALLFARNFSKHSGSTQAFQATHLGLGTWDGGAELETDRADSFFVMRGVEALKDYAFADVYWADIPRAFDEGGHRLEESTTWGRSVVERFTQRHRDGLQKDFGESGPRLAAHVIQEVIETVMVLKFFVGWVEKAGGPKFDLGEILAAYLGDVQQVGDFQHQREKICLRFLKRMAFLAENFPDVQEIHIIAHSEGTVVSFHGLLTAMHAGALGAFKDEDGVAPKASWLEKVRSYSTLGSPIDKHLVLFPGMWKEFEDARGFTNLPVQPIRWHNYYDCADPVGYELDTARTFIGGDFWNPQGRAFDFTGGEPDGPTDHGFRRYAIPGKAHVDYFGDDDLFAHVIANAVGTPPVPTTADTEIRDRAPNGIVDTAPGQLSFVIPALIVIALHLPAVFVFDRALGTKGSPGSNWPVLGCAALLLGTTVLARTLRMTSALDPLKRAWKERGSGRRKEAFVMAGENILQTVLAAVAFFACEILFVTNAGTLTGDAAVGTSRGRQREHDHRRGGGLRPALVAGHSFLRPLLLLGPLHQPQWPQRPHHPHRPIRAVQKRSAQVGAGVPACSKHRKPPRPALPVLGI